MINLARQIARQDKERIDSMSKKRLGSYIMRVNPSSGKFRYAVKKFVKKR